MKIELKKIKVAEHMSEETTAFTAELFVDGKNIGYVKNDGRGGCTDYYSNPDEKSRKALQAAEAYCLTLPEVDYGAFKHKMNLETFIDELLEKHLKEKDQIKLTKKMVNTIMWGVPNGHSYMQVKLSKPLAECNIVSLQNTIDKYKKEFKEGEQFLNTNLEVLGIKL
jgi:hypothetical protein